MPGMRSSDGSSLYGCQNHRLSEATSHPECSDLREHAQSAKMQPAYQVLSRRQQGSPKLCIFVFDQVKDNEEPPKVIQLMLMDQILGLAIRFWNFLFSK